MAEYIKTLKEDNGDVTYPVTKSGAVLLDNGSDLETELTNYVTAEDIASVADLEHPITTSLIADNAVTTAKIADNTITTGDVNWSNFGATWSTFYFTNTASTYETTVTTKKGTQLTIQVGNQGTGVRIIAGGGNIYCVRQYWGARYTANNTTNWRINGLKSGSSVYTTYYGARNAGSSINVGMNTTTAGTGVDGHCYADLASLSGGKVASSVEYVATKVDETTQVWELMGIASGKGTSTNISFSAECTSAAGFVPAIYQAGASVAWGWNILEVLEP